MVNGFTMLAGKRIVVSMVVFFQIIGSFLGGLSGIVPVKTRMDKDIVFDADEMQFDTEEILNCEEETSCETDEEQNETIEIWDESDEAVNWDETAETEGADVTETSGQYELLVAAEDRALFRKKEIILSECEGVYLLSFRSREELERAKSYYLEKAEFVEENCEVTCADLQGKEMTNEEGDGTDDEISSEPDKESNYEIGSVMTPSLIPGRFETKYDGSIALIDTGANEINVVEQISLISEFGDDDNGHGTKMARIIKGIYPEGKIVSIKVLDEGGHGKISDIYTAIEIAIIKGVDVINLSLSGSAAEGSQVLRKAVEDASNVGITVVGAAGNSGRNAKYYVPGVIEAAVIVGCSDEKGKRLEISNYGDSVDYYLAASSTSEAAAKMSALLLRYGQTGINAEVMTKYKVFQATGVSLEDTDKQPPEKDHHNRDDVMAADAKYEPMSSQWVKATKDVGGTRFYQDWEGDPAVCIMEAASNMALEAYLDVKPTYYKNQEVARLLFWVTRDYDISTTDGKDDISNIMRTYYAEVSGGDLRLYNEEVLKNHTTTSNNQNIRDLIKKYKDKSIPDKYLFTVKYLAQDENLNGKPSRGGSGLESTRYQDFLSWHLEEKTKMYGVVEKVLQSGSGMNEPIEGIEFDVFLKDVVSGNWFNSHALYTIKTDKDGIAVWKGGGKELGLGTEVDLDQNGILDVEQGYYVKEKINDVTRLLGISVDTDRKYNIPLYYYTDEGTVPTGQKLKEGKKGVKVINRRFDYYLRIVKSSFLPEKSSQPKDSFEGIEYVLKDPEKNVFAHFILNKDGELDAKKSYIENNMLSENGGADGKKVLFADICERQDADGKTYIFLHWVRNMNSLYSGETEEGTSYGWTLTEVKSNSYYVLDKRESGKFSLRPEQLRTLAYSATIPTLKDNAREYVVMQKKPAAGYEGIVQNNKDYSLEGTTYCLYRTVNDAQKKENAIGTFVCTENGNSNVIDVSAYMNKSAEGAFSKTVFYAREKTAGKGYRISEEVITITVEPGAKKTAFSAEDQPMSFKLLIQKNGLRDGRNAEFEVKQNNVKLRFKKIADGHYTKTVNEDGTSLIQPDETGKLEIEGLQSKEYEITEVRTEEGKTLLKDSFYVRLLSDEITGTLKETILTVDGKETIVKSRGDDAAYIELMNESGIYLSAGGEGTGAFRKLSLLLFMIAVLLGLAVGRDNRVRKKKLLLFLIFIFCSQSLVDHVVSCDVYAKEQTYTDTDNSSVKDTDKIIDSGKKCVLHIRYFDDEKETAPVERAVFYLYKLADIGVMGEIIPVSKEAFIQDTLQGKGNGIDEETILKIKEYFKQEMPQHCEKGIIQNGVLDVETTSGVYLLVEEESAPYHYPSRPGLVQLPYVENEKGEEQVWQYERTVYPKAELFGNLSLEKRLIGNAVEQNKVFTFQVSFVPEGTYSYEKSDGTKGDLVSGNTILLQGGEIAVIQRIPAGTKYKITEIGENTEGYMTTYQNEQGSIEGKKTVCVVVTNTKNDSPKTGDGELLNYMLLMLGAVVGIIGIIYKRKKDELNDKLEREDS